MDRRETNLKLSPLRPYLISLGCAGLVAMAAIAGQWLINVRFGFRRFHGIGLVGPTISFLVTGVLVCIIELRARQRRKARLVRARIVADCNHEIRNALQSMVGLTYPQESVDYIRAAVKRIDWALRDLLPQYQDDDSVAQQWERRQGRLKPPKQTATAVADEVGSN